MDPNGLFIEYNYMNTQLSLLSISCVQTRPNFGVILSLYGPIWPYLGPKWAIFVIGMRPEIIFRVYLYKCTTFLLKHFLCSNYFIWPNCGFILSLYDTIWPLLGPKWAILLLVWGQKTFLEFTYINKQLSFYSISCVQTI